MSLITVPGRDIIVVNEENLLSGDEYSYKVHLVRLSFENPTDDKMEWVMQTFRKTNRYVIDTTHIRYYNYYLKRTNLKYYIINTKDSWRGLVSFFKRNNKVLLDITQLSLFEKQFVMNVALDDVISNTEVLLMDKEDYTDNLDVFNQWKGDIILKDENYPI
jgi:hypothetical protein